MNVGEIRTLNVIVTYPDRPLAEAARAMRDHHIGALVVLDPADPQRVPRGILTDRDILRAQIARQADIYCLTVDDAMSRNPLTLGLETGISEAIEAMNSRAVRRAPVVDGNGTLAGIVTLDDLMPVLARELQELARIMGAAPSPKL